jgi:hypothetical protein
MQFRTQIPPESSQSGLVMVRTDQGHTLQVKLPHGGQPGDSIVFTMPAEGQTAKEPILARLEDEKEPATAKSLSQKATAALLPQNEDGGTASWGSRVLQRLLPHEIYVSEGVLTLILTVLFVSALVMGVVAGVLSAHPPEEEYGV